MTTRTFTVIGVTPPRDAVGKNTRRTLALYDPENGEFDAMTSKVYVWHEPYAPDDLDEALTSGSPDPRTVPPVDVTDPVRWQSVLKHSGGFEPYHLDTVILNVWEG